MLWGAIAGTIPDLDVLAGFFMKDVFLVMDELQALMFGNLLIQLGLLVLEVVGYQRGIITELSGVLPNSILHLCLIVGFGYFLKR